MSRPLAIAMKRVVADVHCGRVALTRGVLTRASRRTSTTGAMMSSIRLTTRGHVKVHARRRPASPIRRAKSGCVRFEQTLGEPLDVIDRNCEPRLTISYDFGNRPRLGTDAGQTKMHSFHKRDPKGLEARRQANTFADV